MKYNFKKHHADFELDLAPLLAVMVKLVPVLLISSAFVQLNLIENDLNPSVQNSIQATNENRDFLKLIVKNNHAVEISSKINGKTSTATILENNNKMDLVKIYDSLKEIKNSKTDLFSLTLKPDETTSQQEIVSLIDLASKGKKGDTFEFMDPKTKVTQHTNLMFPKINFER